MASLFLNSPNVVLGTANCVVYTVPATANAIVFSLFVCNIGDNDTTANVMIYDNSQTKYFRIAHKIPITAQNAWYSDKPVALMPNDQLYVRGANCEVIPSILELY